MKIQDRLQLSGCTAVPDVCVLLFGGALSSQPMPPAAKEAGVQLGQLTRVRYSPLAGVDEWSHQGGLTAAAHVSS